DRFLARPDRGVCLALALLAAFVLMAFLVPDHPLEAEKRWAEWMEDIRTPALEHVALVFNAAGQGLVRAVCLAAGAVALALGRRWLALLAFAAAETLALGAANLTKAVVGRPRPPDALVHASGSAFPSTHAAYAGVTCVALVLLFTQPGPRRRFWWALAAV